MKSPKYVIIVVLVVLVLASFACGGGGGDVTAYNKYMNGIYTATCGEDVYLVSYMRYPLTNNGTWLTVPQNVELPVEEELCSFELVDD